MTLKVRPLTAAEADAPRWFASSYIAPYSEVQRVQVVWVSARGEAVPIIPRQIGSPPPGSVLGSASSTGMGSQVQATRLAQGTRASTMKPPAVQCWRGHAPNLAV
jgi:hypothetical protein